MKSLYHYLAESAKSYGYRIKSVSPMDQEFVERVKKTLFKYDIQEVSKPKKLMAQKAPMDFQDFPMAEIWILDIKTSIPASSYVMATELRSAFQIIDKMLIVRGDNDPVEIEAQRIEEIQKEDHEALLNQPAYEEADQPQEVAYGDSYNKKFLNYLAQIKADAEVHGKDTIEAIQKSSKFSWLTKRDDTVAQDFNADHDTVKPVHVNTKKAGGKTPEPNLAGNHGNYDEKIRRKV